MIFFAQSEGFSGCWKESNSEKPKNIGRNSDGIGGNWGGFWKDGAGLLLSYTGTEKVFRVFPRSWERAKTPELMPSFAIAKKNKILLLSILLKNNRLTQGLPRENTGS